MPRYDRCHALSVLRALQAEGQRDPDLLAAALLHDAGKTSSAAGRLRLGHRVAMVLLGAVRPGLIARTGQEHRGGWRQAFFLQAHHAEIGAELALQAGCSHATAELIRRHENRSEAALDPRLAALQAADAAN
jgi:hypothetical protein